MRYNEVRQKSVHNSYQRYESIADQFLYWRVRSMEVDIHHADVFGHTMRDDWAVYHDWHDPISTVARLSQVLRTVGGLHDLVPAHEVFTLFVDIKDGFSKRVDGRHSWAKFDALLEAHLGEWLYRPRDLLAASPMADSLRAAVADGWPTLAALRGRVIVVLTGSRANLNTYAARAHTARDRAAFIAAPVDGAGDIPGPGDEVFFNIDGETNMDLVRRVHPLGYISRAYYVNSWEHWREAVAADCHHIATDQVNERVDPFASTRNSQGYPFRRLDRVPVAGGETGTVAGIWARTDDLWERRDSFMFNYRDAGTEADPTRIDAADYQVAIAGPNSHTEDFTKGALMARATLDADSAYFAVVRTGENHSLRLQYRRTKGGQTAAVSAAIGPSGMFGFDIDADTIVHVRLRVNAGGTTVEGWGSYDRAEWTPMGAMTFDEPLRLHGVGVSGHGQRRGAKFLFVMPHLDDAEWPFAERKLIGADRNHAGWIDWTDTGRWLTRQFSSWAP